MKIAKQKEACSTPSGITASRGAGVEHQIVDIGMRCSTPSGITASNGLHRQAHHP
ncbi:hypothetical protein OWM54_22425 [Myxococcus sp. MISCRS1]|uniref:hypothetical protein n=1 Tax=Myxococcus TaxID=32 RepID=UPI002271F44D|nr:hypothetical protein [Myxococcus sp. MISCRS1]MCY0999895.1 hypothetical protein [Myxococcus sp. MISCRS1]